MGTVIATLITGLVGLLLGLWFVRGMRIEKANKDYFLLRERVPVRDLVQQIDGVVRVQQAEDIWKRLADSIEMDPLKLRPEDQFYGKRRSIDSFGLIWDWQIDEAFFDECDRSGADRTQGEHITTIADYIRFFCAGASRERVA